MEGMEAVRCASRITYPAVPAPGSGGGVGM